jgi:hypothetical protein
VRGAAATCVAAVLALGVPSVARADDDKQDELTLLPWTDATLVFSSGDDRGAVSYAQTSGSGIGLHLKASAPLDDDTRIAALTDSNKLVGGFAASLQVGWDTRADYVKQLAAAAAEAADAVDELGELPDWTSSGAQARYAASFEPGSAPGSGDEIQTHLCTQAGIDNDHCQLPAMLSPLCAKYLGGSCATDDEFYAKATAYGRAHCQTATTPSDACAAAGFGAAYLQRAKAYGTVNRFVGDKPLFVRIVGLYEQLDPDAKDALAKCQAGGQTAEQCMVAKLSDFVDKAEELVRTAPLERRDFLLTAVRDRPTWDFALMLGASLSYDRSTVYQDDIASKAKSAVAYDFAIGPDLTAYAPMEGLSVNARIGLSRTRETGASTFERCATVTSSNGDVTGRRCNSKALFRAGGSPDPESSGFVRLAVDYQYRGTVSKDDLIPGVELRAGIDGIGQDLVAQTRLTLFGTPVSGNAAARVGVAVDLSYAIDHDDASEDPRWVVTPLVFVGATLADLMSH